MHLFLALGTLCFAGTSALVVPEDVASILSLIYFNIPPIFKGTDSRLGVGFALGRHADAQIVLELGPQIETEPLGKQPASSSSDKRRRFIESPSSQKKVLEYQKPQNNPLIASWLSRWRNALVQNNPPQKISSQTNIIKMDPKNHEKMAQLQKLYKSSTEAMETKDQKNISN